MSKHTWTGYLRPDGRKGVRNIVLVIYTVECAKEVARGKDDAHVLGFPGCYDNDYAIRLTLALATHPNVGAVLIIGLGCEYTQPKRISEVVAKSGRPVEWFYIQDKGGTASSIGLGKARLRDTARRSAVRVSMSWSDLTVGAEYGGSDGTSGLSTI
jgi:altronate dehydratase large subunit